MNTPLSITETSASQGHRAVPLCLPLTGTRLLVRDVWCTKCTSSMERNTDSFGNEIQNGKQSRGAAIPVSSMKQPFQLFGGLCGLSLTPVRE